VAREQASERGEGSRTACRPARDGGRVASLQPRRDRARRAAGRRRGDGEDERAETRRAQKSEASHHRGQGSGVGIVDQHDVKAETARRRPRRARSELIPGSRDQRREALQVWMQVWNRGAGLEQREAEWLVVVSG